MMRTVQNFFCSVRLNAMGRDRKSVRIPYGLSAEGFQYKLNFGCSQKTHPGDALLPARTTELSASNLLM